MHMTQCGDPRKAKDRVVDMVRSEGMVRGKRIPARFPLGEDGLEIIRKNCSEKTRICDEWEALTSDTGFNAEC